MSKKVHLLDYVAGNIRSLVNAIEALGYEVEWIRKPEDIAHAEVGNRSFQFSRNLFYVSRQFEICYVTLATPYLITVYFWLSL